VGRAANDMGYHWNGECYEMILSEYDTRQRGLRFNKEIPIKYAELYLEDNLRDCEMQGFTFTKTKTEDKRILFTGVRY
jgi:hypothetical protein